MNWRNANSLADLLTFAAGKIISRDDFSGQEATTYFSDGTAIRITAEEGQWYSGETGGDPPNIVWEIGTP